MSTSYTQDELRSVHASLVEVTASFEQACLNEWRSTQPSDSPSVLYHYCTAQTFHLIAESGIVWASDIRFLNDASEMSYASDLLKSIIEDVSSKVEKDDERELVRRLSNTFDLRDLVHVFAFCCSELEDSIPQWVAYGGRRGGIAIGLDLRPRILRVHDHTEKLREPPYASLFKVIYDANIQREAATKMIAQLLPIYRETRDKFKEPLWTFVMADICRMARDGLSNLMLSIKQPGFEHEKEWRLVVAQEKTDPPLYRVGPIGLVPYIPLKLTHWAGVYTKRFPIRRIVQGPTSELELGVEALRGFCRHLDLAHAEVSSSKMPLRF